MTLQSSGTISLDDVHVELGESSGTTVSLNDTDVRTLAGVPSGAISLSDFYGKTAADGVFNITVGYNSNNNSYGYVPANSQGSMSPTHRKGVAISQCYMLDGTDNFVLSLRGNPDVAQNWDQLIVNDVPSVGSVTFTRTSLEANKLEFPETSTWIIPWTHPYWSNGQEVTVEITSMADFTTYGFIVPLSGTTDLPWLQGAIGYVRGFTGSINTNFDRVFINNEEYILSASYTKDGNYQLSIDWGDLGSPPLVKTDISNVIVQQLSAVTPSFPLGTPRTYNPANSSYTVSSNTGSWVWTSQETLDDQRTHTVEIN